MKVTIDGKRYDSSRCEILGEYDHHSYSGNYSGTTYLLRAADGALLIHTDSNGQDCHICNAFYAFDESDYTIDDFEMTDEQEARCAELGLITIV